MRPRDHQSCIWCWDTLHRTASGPLQRSISTLPLLSMQECCSQEWA